MKNLFKKKASVPINHKILDIMKNAIGRLKEQGMPETSAYNLVIATAFSLLPDNAQSGNDLSICVANYLKSMYPATNMMVCSDKKNLEDLEKNLEQVEGEVYDTLSDTLSILKKCSNNRDFEQLDSLADSMGYGKVRKYYKRLFKDLS